MQMVLDDTRWTVNISHLSWGESGRGLGGYEKEKEHKMTVGTKEDIQMADKPMKRCSIANVVRELKVRTTVRYHHQMLVRLLSNKNYSVLMGTQNGTVTLEDSLTVSHTTKRAVTMLSSNCPG